MHKDKTLRTEQMKPDSLILEGPNVLLRPVRLSDVNEDYCRWMNDPEVNRFMETRFRPQSMGDIQSYIREMLNTTHVAFMAIISKEGERHIGNIKLGPVSTKHKRGEISFFIGEKSLWGKGLATEAVTLLTDYGLKQLNLIKITAGCYSNNQASRNVFEKSGYVVEGIWKNHYCYNEKFVDRICYSKSNVFYSPEISKS